MQIELKKYKCEKHGNIGDQTLKIGYFDSDNQVVIKTFCAICHVKMLEDNCCEALLASPEESEEKIFKTRGIHA